MSNLLWGKLILKSWFQILHGQTLWVTSDTSKALEEIHAESENIIWMSHADNIILIKLIIHHTTVFEVVKKNQI